MKKILLLSIFVLLNLSVVANAAESKIAVVNMQAILEKASAAVDIRERIKKQSEQYLAEITKEEDKLRADEKKLASESGVLAKEVLEKKRKEFQDKVIKVQKNAQDKRANLDNSFKNSLEQVDKVISEIIGELAKEKGFEVAMPTSQIIYWQKELDITDEVLTRLDKKLPKVKTGK
jgi:Skp family chaperone for outer membrane proteins